ncbi:MAG: 16S rRNA (guanine(966)-N(2))-methyltransferase RsmD [Verrucomicrobia bacterium]|nr:16S rRNA (guanine(966)-N(2))-methyltransferase RsmD [Verrucomicrobiota bacterium]
MRITGGILRGRVLRVPRKGLRPTQERVREALFSSIGEDIVGARVLDLYAGSGALGLEAWSRGASFVCWVESHGPTYRNLKRNVGELCGNAEDRTQCVQMKADAYIGTADNRRPFDLIMADPPYDEAIPAGLPGKALRTIQRRSMLSARGLVVFELSAGCPHNDLDGWNIVRDKVYGETRLVFFRLGEVRDISE